MSQPVKLSDALVLKARQTAATTERSIAGQIEFWANLGEVLEKVLDGQRVQTLRQQGTLRPLSELIATVDTAEGRQRVADYLATRPFPHFEEAPEGKGLLVKIDADGTRTVGRFVDREFKAVRRKKPQVA